MSDVTPNDSDSMRDLRRFGPIAQALFTVVFAIVACVVALFLMGSTPIPSVLGPAPAVQHLAAAPETLRDALAVPSSFSNTDIHP